MKQILHTLGFALLCNLSLQAQNFSPVSEEMIWEALNDLSAQEDGEDLKLVFSERILELEGKEISVRGLILKEQQRDDYYIIYHKDIRQDMCRGFDVGQALEFPINPQIQKGDIVTLKGRLRLNRNNRDALVYQLENVELIKKHYD